MVYRKCQDKQAGETETTAKAPKRTAIQTGLNPFCVGASAKLHLEWVSSPRLFEKSDKLFVNSISRSSKAFIPRHL